MLVELAREEDGQENEENGDGEDDEQYCEERRDEPGERQEENGLAFRPTLLAVERAARGRDEMEIIDFFHAQPAEFTCTYGTTDVIARAVVELFNGTFA